MPSGEPQDTPNPTRPSGDTTAPAAGATPSPPGSTPRRTLEDERQGTTLTIKGWTPPDEGSPGAGDTIHILSTSSAAASPMPCSWPDPLPKGEEEPREKWREEHQPKPHHLKPRSSSQGGPRLCDRSHGASFRRGTEDPSTTTGSTAQPTVDGGTTSPAAGTLHGWPSEDTIATPPPASGNAPATAHGPPSDPTPHALDGKTSHRTLCTSAATSKVAREAGAVRTAESTGKAEGPAADVETGTTGKDTSPSVPIEPGSTEGAPASGKSGKSSPWNTDGSAARGAWQAAAKCPTSPHREQERV
ncbi:uncharacterized protein [Procambarus clarkii]|uniref:uncharacterized protein n=1 Tax=Procambarus clarkii TaxID=6728 RepID=UPI00374249FA